eukprot:TRINITY_DN19356_c0_g1_i1.p1 TRINITY_DN19356_c0_g1~~TRINITY_DN19356_c0_g1_i1.p1  ORF type:complete len:879 (+),score=155.44 TRINITY_DN19356_c0_g1_i1:139-2775(+)
MCPMSDELASPIRKYVATHSSASGASAKASPKKGPKDAPAVSSVAPAAVAADPAMEAKVQSLLSVGEECISEPELRSLLQRKPNFVLYDGFEPSGRMHIAQGIFKAINVNKCTEAGGTFKFWVADWFGLMNDKMGGDLEKIKDVGKYLIEVWKSTGMKMDNVKFIWCEQYLGELAARYWTQMLDISRTSNLTRIKKCGMIMGRDQDGDLSSAQILYPIMQCTDIFALEADICQLGVDQRKVNMLARDYCDAIGRKIKPVILSHHMLYGLSQGQAKMSKSNPDSAVFMEDSEEDVRRKISKAYCPKNPGEKDVLATSKCKITIDKSMPPKITACSGFGENEPIAVGDSLLAVNDEPIGECIKGLDLANLVSKASADKPVILSVRAGAAPKERAAETGEDAMRLVKDDLENPILDYIKHIILGAPGAEPITIDGKVYKSEAEIRAAFTAGGYEKKGVISKAQMKEVVIDRVNVMLKSSRKHFTENKEAADLLKLVEKHKEAVSKKEVTAPKSVRCLKEIDAFKAGCSGAVVFAPRPAVSPALSVDVVLSTLVALNQASKKGEKVVLWCEDWGAFCLNSCSSSTIDGALQLITTWYNLLVDCLKLVAPDLMSKVDVLFQSKEILKKPNAYWISAIDVGRTFKLDRIRQSLADGETLTESSQVVTTLMHTADLLSLSAAKGLKQLTVVPVLQVASVDQVAAAPCACVSANMHKSAAKYIEEAILPKAKACGENIIVPVVTACALSKDVPFGVMIGEGEAALNTKIKKFYCLAGDVENNPCIETLEKLDAAGALRRNNPKDEFLVIKGSEKSGYPEDRCFADAKRLRDEFAKGETAIHPGDLKASVAPLVRGVLGPLFACKDAAFTKAHKELSAAAKKAPKKK